jgi:GTP-binding protein
VSEPLKIKDVEFAGAIGAPGGEAPGVLPQIAFSGRSNVGKSSLINRLLGRTRTHIARVSSTPGKTQEINFFRVRAATPTTPELEFFLVDLPGYGFAQVPVAVRDSWRPLIHTFLSRSLDLRGVVQLIDARHGPSAEDRQMVDYLAELGVPAVFAFTKIDKLKWSQREKHLAETIRDLGVTADQVIPFSAETGEGREELLESLAALFDAQPEAVDAIAENTTEGDAA